MDLILNLFSGALSKIAPVLFFLLLFSVVTNYVQADRNNQLKVENRLIKERLGDVIAENNALSALVEKREKERDMNQHLVDQLNQDNHKLQQQASQVQTQIRTVIKHEKCYDTAIPDAATERMRKQYSSSNTIQNDRTPTASQSH
ncbi:DUF2570 family protein [Methylophaga sp.]|uniref:DUF2570 family protein n=1 Tax=Methylophaga sp. TaxID=2024840 RepID=UPI003A917020